MGCPCQSVANYDAVMITNKIRAMEYGENGRYYDFSKLVMRFYTRMRIG